MSRFKSPEVAQSPLTLYQIQFPRRLFHYVCLYKQNYLKFVLGKPPAVDLVFTLDASNDTSVEKGFDYQRQLVRSLLDGFSISPSGTRVSIASCRWPYSHVNFNLNKIVNKECAMAWIPTLR